MANGHHIIATITRSTELELQVVGEVFALIKPQISSCSAVLKRFVYLLATIFRHRGPYQAGAVNSEIIITVGENTLAVVITNGSVASLQLEKGTAITAAFKASSVIIGRPF